MSVSVIEYPNRKLLRIGLNYLLISVLCAGFGAVYELFSYGVYSFFMIYAFMFPLAGGGIPFAALALAEPKRRRDGTAEMIWHWGIAALTVGSIIRGVLDIYGTTNALTAVYWFAGGGLLVVAITVYLVRRKKRRRHS